jgi:Fe-S-cluster formation regulator IscX/YfhJ
MADEVKKAKTKEQIAKLEQLQDLILDDMIDAVKNNRATATDRATIIRLLQSNGWDLDPSKLGDGDLKSKLTSKKRFDEDLSAEETGERRLKAI